MPSNLPPDWYDDSDMHEDCVRTGDAEKCFKSGLQSMREMLARFVEQGGHPEVAQSMRLNWNPSWGDDPGKPDEIANNWDACL